MKLPPQYEDPDKAASVALFKMRTPQAQHPLSKVSGAQILNFQKGWAIPILLIDAHVSHWFERRSDDFATSLCGLESLLDLIHGPGTYPRCQRCIKKMTLLIRRGAM